MTFANNLDPDPQNVGLHLRSKLFDIQIIYHQKKIWVEPMNFLKVLKETNIWKNYPACKELRIILVQQSCLYLTWWRVHGAVSASRPPAGEIWSCHCAAEAGIPTPPRRQQNSLKIHSPCLSDLSGFPENMKESKQLSRGYMILLTTFDFSKA